MNTLSNTSKTGILRGARMNDVPAPVALERCFDVFCATLGLLLLMPLWIGAALTILIEDGEPVLFSQTRVGRGGKPFRIWKFRTMRAGSTGSAITAGGDDRITRAGAILRKYKLDELPQLFNVLKGEMSLVGPRPEVPEFVQLESPVWQRVLKVRPGITDLATLVYRDEEQILATSPEPAIYYRQAVLPAKLRLNEEYLPARSFGRDLKLIFLTIRYSLFAQEFDPKLIKRLLLETK